MKITGDVAFTILSTICPYPCSIYQCNWVWEGQGGNWAKRFQTDDEYISLITSMKCARAKVFQWKIK